jgi:hypothetical protein
MPVSELRTIARGLKVYRTSSNVREFLGPDVQAHLARLDALL